LTRIEAYNLEKECLTIINEHFECICKIKHNHFPELIEFDDEKYQLLLSNCGICIKEYIRLKKNKSPLQDLHRGSLGYRTKANSTQKLH